MKRYSKEEKAKRLEDWKRSGKSLWAYARENRINPQTFNKWTKKKEGPGFVRIPQAVGTGITAERNEILIESGEIKIHLPPGIAAQELCAVVKSLGGLV
jgi:transposase-like protein